MSASASASASTSSGISGTQTPVSCPTLPPAVLHRYDHLFKIIVIGDQSVGKTNLTLSFTENCFDKNYVGTIGIDFKVRTVIVDGKRIKLQVWDTAGQERFKTMTQVYYRGTMGVIFVYDITNRDSFQHIRNWIQTFDDISGAEAKRIIVGNKSDMFPNRQVEFDEAERIAGIYDCRLFETSAKTGYNVENAFMTLAKDIKDYQELKMDKRALNPPPAIVLQRDNRSRYRRSKTWIAAKCNLL